MSMSLYEFEDKRRLLEACDEHKLYVAMLKTSVDEVPDSAAIVQAMMRVRLGTLELVKKEFGPFIEVKS